MPRSTSAAVDAAKSRAQHLATRLKALGVSLRHTQALEALAASEGFRDWNRYQAHLESSPQRQSMPSVERKRVLFLGRPGTGKTSACMAWAFKTPLQNFVKDPWEGVPFATLEYPSASVLWIEGVHDGHGYDLLPAPVRAEVDRVKVRFNEEGILLPNDLEKEPLLPKQTSRWIEVCPTFSTSLLYSEAGDKAYAAAMDALLIALRPLASFWDRVIFDELRQRPNDLETFLSRVSQTPWNSSASVVVNSQAWLVDTAPESLVSDYLLVGQCHRAPAVTLLPQQVPIHHQMSSALLTALSYPGTP